MKIYIIKASEHVYIHIYTCTYRHMHTCINVPICKYTQISIYDCTIIQACIRTHILIYMT